MAVAIGILIKVILMILFCSIEVLQWHFLHHQGLLIVLLLAGIHLFDNGQIRFVGIVDAGPVAGAFVVTLLVETRRVDGLEEHPEQELQADHIGIVLDMYRLSIAGRVGIDFFISRVLRMAIGKSYLCTQYSLYLLKVMLCTPKTSPRKVDVLRFG